MNPEQLQSLAVLVLSMVLVALLWWVWIRMFDTAAKIKLLNFFIINGLRNYAFLARSN